MPGDVALGVDLQVLQAVRLGHRQEGAGAGLLLERRRGDLGQCDDVLDRAVVLGGQGGDGRAVGLAGHDVTDNRLGLTGHGIRFPSAVGRYWPRPAPCRKGRERTWIWSPDCNRNCRRCRVGWGSPSRSREPDRVVAELTVREDLCTAGDIMHGGAIMAFADTVGALGTVVNLREGQGTTTVESKTNFFAGSPMGTRLIAEATPLHRGRRTQVWETRITNEQGRLVAKVTQTQMVL